MCLSVSRGWAKWIGANEAANGRACVGRVWVHWKPWKKAATLCGACASPHFDLRLEITRKGPLRCVAGFHRPSRRNSRNIRRSHRSRRSRRSILGLLPTATNCAHCGPAGCWLVVGLRTCTAHAQSTVPSPATGRGRGQQSTASTTARTAAQNLDSQPVGSRPRLASLRTGRDRPES